MSNTQSSAPNRRALELIALSNRASISADAAEIAERAISGPLRELARTIEAISAKVDKLKPVQAVQPPARKVETNAATSRIGAPDPGEYFKPSGYASSAATGAPDPDKYFTS